MSKKILIIGNNPNACALAKHLLQDNEIFMIPINDGIKSVINCIDLREDNVLEILEFVMENQIDMTIVLSNNTLKTDIVEVFNKNNQQIFAPTTNASKLIFDKFSAKKLFYKLRIPTPKFGIFEKQNMVLDYIKNLKNPFLLKTDESSSATVFTSFDVAKKYVDTAYIDKNNKILIEDYVYGTPFKFYVITDGYKAMPIGSSINYRYFLEGNGGQLTSGMGACVPNYKLTNDDVYFLMDCVVYQLLDYFNMENSPYIGILGLDCIKSEDNSIQVLSVSNFMEDTDTEGILNSIDENIYDLFESCIIGSFSDEYDILKINENCNISVVLHSVHSNKTENIINGIDNLDDNIDVLFYPNVKQNKYLEFEAVKGANIILSATAQTITNAKEKVYSNINELSFDGLTYRKDIAKA